MFYMMKSKYAIFFNTKVSKIKRSTFLWDTQYLLQVFDAYVYIKYEPFCQKVDCILRYNLERKLSDTWITYSHVYNV